jgi:LysR family transcriptional regulator, hypochlorite-specific transcription factor HypT
MGMQFRKARGKLRSVQVEGAMRLEWLEDILAVAKTGSFTRAAHQRNVTASAFSRRIQGIEDHLGVALFDRTRKPVQLMPGVADQREAMERLVAELRQLTGALQRGDGANHIVVASQHALTAALTPGLVARIHAAQADVYLRLRSANLDECFAMLFSRQADIALVYRVAGTGHPISADYIETVQIGEDVLLPVCAAMQFSAFRTGMEKGVLRVIAYPQNVFLGEVLTQRVYPALPPDCRILPVAETALTLAAQELALAGLGVAWLPQSLVQAKLQDGRLTDLSETLPKLALDVTAVRLIAQRTAVEAAVWLELTAQAAEAVPSPDSSADFDAA